MRKVFVRRSDAGDPEAPMAALYRSGRNGAVAVKLYLALLWRCSAPPFDTDKPARAWATLLDLDDPENAGARRIKNAMKTLREAGLIEVLENPGYPNLVRLLDESGNREPYTLPSTAYTKAKQTGAKPGVLARQMYFKIPPQLWTDGYIQELNGPGLAMLLILLAEQGGEGEAVWFSTTEFPQRYSISHKTRAAGTRELVNARLLTVDSESIAVKMSRAATTFDPRRRRKIYRLAPPAQSTVTEVEGVTQLRKARRRKRKKDAGQSTATVS
ncbi:hypothetical protein ACFUEJ_11230 [Gordonia sp. NPDC057258]|uniref:hypothetical protein n=1 Tax=unclassified Gordonia (in: high G+C Gram-positive bacteria) TaxID=2657482 RepID=UPI003635CE83